MPKYKVTVCRIVRESIEIEVDAPDKETAALNAELEAQCADDGEWDCYGCEYDTEACHEAQ